MNASMVRYHNKNNESFYQLLLKFISSPVSPFSKDIKITGPTTVYTGDEVTLTCEAGPSYPGQDFFFEILKFIMTF